MRYLKEAIAVYLKFVKMLEALWTHWATWICYTYGVLFFQRMYVFASNTNSNKSYTIHCVSSIIFIECCLFTVFSNSCLFLWVIEAIPLNEITLCARACGHWEFWWKVWNTWQDQKMNHNDNKITWGKNKKNSLLVNVRNCL